MVYLWLIMIAIAALQVPVMLKRRHYRTLLVFSGLWLFSGLYASLFISRFPLPDVIGILIDLIK